ncbi:MAG: bifunctional adenosylcobinamide kinase/adenosylcobinamide-phosphate guanylyltransferase [Gemmiger sp.]|uniref:bifunctional adenosylcobinamide kinase/adenosylcobinamide-phosphate guanylyltransferase n=1 Tax=Gemmiger sp. TaxID=2049027 RepID=UPI00300F79F2
MLFVTGPLYSGKRTFSQKFGGRQICDVQNLAANATDLEKLADELAAYDVVIATEIGGGIVPIDPAERAAREAAGRLACLLAARASCVVEMFCGLSTVLKGELPKC